jgi:hypothetical protein
MVVQRLQAQRFSTLAECAEVTSHQDPMGLVLHLCAAGHLRVDRTRPLSPDTLVAASY